MLGWQTGVRLTSLPDDEMGVDDDLPPCSTGDECAVLGRVQVCVSDEG